MFYIVSYVTHTESYFNILKKSCPDIIILGYGDKWINWYTRIHKILDFCKTKNANDIICAIDGFDTVVLSSPDEILNKYKSLKYDIVFSKALNPNNTIIKYGQDKLFGRCNNYNLNAGMYIGNAKALIDFWKDIDYNDDEQTYATKICRESSNINVGIDINNILFYNYSKIDNIKISDNRILLNNIYPCVISAPGNHNINHILSKIGYTNLPDIKFDYNYRIKTYLKYFKLEILYILLSILILYYSKNKYLAISACFILFLELIHYELYVKHINQKQIYKYVYVLLDLFHISIIYCIFYLFLNFNCDIKKLLLLNTIYSFILLLFFYFKKCILTELENKVLGIDSDFGSVSRKKRLNYFFDIEETYTSTKGNNTIQWLEGNKLIILCIFILNIYCLIKNFK
jgi:hypothetical protein